jgi:hypothetical protein
MIVFILLNDVSIFCICSCSLIISLDIDVSIPSLRLCVISIASRFNHLLAFVIDSFISISSIIFLTFGCISLSSYSSSSCAAAADDELVPLKFPLILDDELAIISPICVGSDSASSNICNRLSSLFLFAVCNYSK